jgi:hypothetical protein
MTLAGGEATPRREKGGETSQKKESYIGMTIRVRVAGTRPIPDPIRTDMGVIFYPHVSPVPDLKQNGYGHRFFTHPQAIPRIPRFQQITTFSPVHSLFYQPIGHHNKP